MRALGSRSRSAGAGSRMPWHSPFAFDAYRPVSRGQMKKNSDRAGRSMCHRVEQDVDADPVGLHGKMSEVVGAHGFFLVCVAEIRVVGHEDDHTTSAVEDRG